MLRSLKMANKDIFVTKPSMPPLSEFLPYLEEIWERQVLTNGGPFHVRLEEELCRHLGVEHVSLFTNGTIALMTALKALDIDGEVITTPFSFVATSHSLVWNNLRPVFVDVAPDTLNLDPAKIRAAITPSTTAILAVHCYGHPCDVAAIQAVADEAGLRVVYDAAHAFGVRHQGHSLLRHGDLSVLSFHATKMFNTFEGGAIVSPSLEVKRRIDRLKNFGIIDETSVAEVGTNGKMSELNAAFGLLQLKHVDEYRARRREVDRLYRKTLQGIPGIRPLHAPRDGDNYSYFPIMVEPVCRIGRDGLYERLKENGIYSRRYFFPLISRFAPYNTLPSAAETNLPVATDAAQRVLCLPMSTDLVEADVRRIVGIIAAAG